MGGCLSSLSGSKEACYSIAVAEERRRKELEEEDEGGESPGQCNTKYYY